MPTLLHGQFPEHLLQFCFHCLEILTEGGVAGTDIDFQLKKPGSGILRRQRCRPDGVFQIPIARLEGPILIPDCVLQPRRQFHRYLCLQNHLQPLLRKGRHIHRLLTRYHHSLIRKLCGYLVGIRTVNPHRQRVSQVQFPAPQAQRPLFCFELQ